MYKVECLYVSEWVSEFVHLLPVNSAPFTFTIYPDIWYTFLIAMILGVLWYMYLLH